MANHTDEHEYSMGDLFKDWNKHKQGKKSDNKAASTNILRERGIIFESKNNGVHLIIHADQGLIDFWPSTGLWMDRRGAKGRGVFNLLKHMREC